MPKSSSTSRTPTPRRERITRSETPDSSKSTDSVSSMLSVAGSMPLASIADETVGSSRGSPIWRPERLTAIRTGAASGRIACQPATLSQASSMTQRPTGTISCDSSATGMNEVGLVSPYSG